MHIFSVTVNRETEPSIIASYPECLEYIARLTDVRGIITDNNTDQAPAAISHLGLNVQRRRGRLIKGVQTQEHITANSVFTGKPMEFTIKLVNIDAPKDFAPQVLQPIIGIRLKDSDSVAIPHRTLITSYGRQSKTLI